MKSPPLHFSEVGRLPRLLSAADRVFDFVIGDLPPLLPDRDGLHLQEHFDGFLFVVRARHAAVETIERGSGYGISAAVDKRVLARQIPEGMEI